MPEQPIRGSDSRSRLGRGLAALLGETGPDAPTQDAAQGVKQVPIEFLRSNARNPRERFESENLGELSDSIKARGILQPILVRPASEARGTFEIVAGERRWRAAQLAGLHNVPVIVLGVDDREALEIAIVENVQRADLNALEEASGYARLAEEFGYNHVDISRVVGKSRSHVANTLRLLNLPAHSRELLSGGAISPGHARALLSLADPDAVADKIVANSLTVRDVENIGKSSTNPNRESKKQILPSDPDTKSFEERLSLGLGVQVNIKRNGDRFDLLIKARDVDQLTHICEKLVAD